MKRAIIGLLTVTLFAHPALGQNISTDAPTVRTWNAQGVFGPWIKKGTLASLSADTAAGELATLIYQTSSGKWIQLSNQLEALNFCLGEEISKDDALPFVKDELAHVLVSAMSPPHSSIITKEYLPFYKEYSSVYNERSFIHYAPKARDQSISTLQHYPSDPTPVVTGNNWTMEFNVVFQSGGIEHWRITGQLAPFMIKSFYRAVLEPSGTILPLLQAG